MATLSKVNKDEKMAEEKIPRVVIFAFFNYKFSKNSLTSTESEEVCLPPAKRSRLFGNYFKSAVQSPSNVSAQLSKYLELSNDFEERSDCIQFWNSEQNKKEFDKLYYAAVRALSVPASSAPVEHVFSRGGLIARPHRAKISDARLSSLIFLKCNSMNQ